MLEQWGKTDVTATLGYVCTWVVNRRSRSKLILALASEYQSLRTFFWHIFNWPFKKINACSLFRFSCSPPDILQRWWQVQQLRGVQVAIQPRVGERLPANGSLRGWEVRWHETEDSFESWSDHERYSNSLAMWDRGVTYGIFMIL